MSVICIWAILCVAASAANASSYDTVRLTPYNAKLSRVACHVDVPKQIFTASGGILAKDTPLVAFNIGWGSYPDICPVQGAAAGRDTAGLYITLKEGAVQDSFRISRPALALEISGKLDSGRFVGPVYVSVSSRPDTTAKIVNPAWIARAKFLDKGIVVEHDAKLWLTDHELFTDEAAYKRAYAVVQAQVAKQQIAAPVIDYSAQPVVALEDGCQFRAPYALLGPGGVLKKPVRQEDVTGHALFSSAFKGAGMSALCKSNKLGEHAYLNMYLGGDRTSKGCKTIVSIAGAPSNAQLVGKITVNLYSKNEGSSDNTCPPSNELSAIVSEKREIWEYKGKLYLSEAALEKAPGGKVYLEAWKKNETEAAARTRAGQLAVLGALGAIATGRGTQVLKDMTGAAPQQPVPSKQPVPRRTASPATATAPEASKLAADGGKFSDQPTYRLSCKGGKAFRVYQGKDGNWYDATESPARSPIGFKTTDSVIKARCGG